MYPLNVTYTSNFMAKFIYVLVEIVNQNHFEGQARTPQKLW
jgi:hypothetical protein